MTSAAKGLRGNKSLRIATSATVAGRGFDHRVGPRSAYFADAVLEIVGFAGIPRIFDLAFTSLRDKIVGLVATIGRGWEIRRATAKLTAADCAILRDLGITRSGIESAVRHGREKPSRN